MTSGGTKLLAEGRTTKMLVFVHQYTIKMQVHLT